MLNHIQTEQTLLSLPQGTDERGERYPYGARSAAAAYVGDLLCAQVPELAAGGLELVAIARRPGVLSKVAIRRPANQPRPLVLGIGADHIARVRDRLDRERIDIVVWQRSAPPYIAAALGLAETPPMDLLPASAHARVLVGEIDVRGIAGWRNLNVIVASALTGWRIRLESVAATAAWGQLEHALAARRPVSATVIGRTERGVRVTVLGLHAILSGASREVRPGEDLDVRVTRLDADEGRVFVSDRLAGTGQLRLPLI